VRPARWGTDMRRKLASLVVPGVCLLAACSADPNANTAMMQSASQLLGSIGPPLIQSFAGRSAEPRSDSRERSSSDASASSQGAGSPPAPSPSQPPPLVSPLPLALPYGPDTCQSGFVWREAVRDDHVCVPPQTRQLAWTDNAQASARRNPAGGPYGSDTCLQGFVWRDASPDDHVCVTPDDRQQTRDDNAQAAERKVHS
jgi:hypothetical protein